MRRTLPFIFSSLFFSVSLIADQYQANVTKVPDGDTIQARHGARTEWIRLNGVDCPESGDPYTTIATKTAIDLLQGNVLTIRPYGMDSHHRIVADVFLPDGSSPNRILVRSGRCRWSHRWK